MKKISLLIIGLVGFVMLSFVQQKQVEITGEAFPEWKDGDPIAMNVSGNTLKTNVKDGKYSFTFQIDEPLFLYVVHEKGRGMVNLMVSPGEKITISGSIREPEIKGAHLQADLEKYILQPFQEQNQRRGELGRQYRDILGKLDNPATQDEVKQTAQYKEYAEKKAALEETFRQELESLFREKANTIWAPMMITYNPAIGPTEELYACLSDKVKNSYYGREMRAELDKMFVGKKAPDFTLKDVSGKEYTLQGLLEGNQYLLVDFWASWCAPCRKGIPEMKEFAKKYADKGVAVVSISTDKDRAAWLKALEEEQMPWTNLLDDAGIKAKYGVEYIPSVFLIDATGIVLFEKLYGEAIGQQLKEILGE